jgi:hypothetical protein
MEETKQIEWEVRGEVLEQEIRQIDPIVFDDESNIWAFLVEELRAGVVYACRPPRCGGSAVPQRSSWYDCSYRPCGSAELSRWPPPGDFSFTPRVEITHELRNYQAVFAARRR